MVDFKIMKKTRSKQKNKKKDNRPAEVKAKVAEAAALKCSLFVGNIPSGMDDESLKAKVCEVTSAISATDILSVRRLTNAQTGKIRPVAFIDVKTKESAEEIVDTCNGLEIDGSSLKVEVARDRSAPAPKKAPAKKETVVAPVKKVESDSDSDSDAETTTPPTATKQVVEEDSDSDSESEKEEKKVVVATPTPAKQVVLQESESESSDEEKEDETNGVAAAVKKAMAAAKSVKTENNVVVKDTVMAEAEESSEEERDVSDDDLNDIFEKSMPKPGDVDTSDEESDEDDEEEDTKIPEIEKEKSSESFEDAKSQASSSDSESDDEEEKVVEEKKENVVTQPTTTNEESASSDSDSDSSDEEKEEPKKVTPPAKVCALVSANDSSACSLFCGNVSENVSDNDLRTLVGTTIPVSKILSIRRLTAVGGGLRPIAFVDLVDKSLAESVIHKLHGKELKGKKLKCELSAKGPPADVLAKAGVSFKRALPEAEAEPVAKKQKVEEPTPVDTSNMTPEEKKQAKKKEKRAKEKAKLKAKKAAAKEDTTTTTPTKEVEKVKAPVAAPPKVISDSEDESEDEQDVVMKTVEPTVDSDNEEMLDNEIAKLEKKLTELKNKKQKKFGVKKIAPKEMKKTNTVAANATPVIDGTPTSVFVGNVDGSVREKALTDLIFKHCPSISKSNLLGIRRLPNRDGGVRPMAFFDFTNENAANIFVKTVASKEIILAEKQLKAEISNKPPPMERWQNKITPPAPATNVPAVQNAKSNVAERKQQPRKNPNKSSVFFGQMHQETTEDQLEQHIKNTCADVELLQIRFLKDKNTGAFRRMAFVDVPNDDAAGEIIEKLHHSSLLGRRLNVEWTGVGRKNDTLVAKQKEKRTEQQQKAVAELNTSLEKFYTCRSGKVLKPHFDDKLIDFLSTCAQSVIGKFCKELRQTSNEELEMRLPPGRESAWLMGVLRRHQSNSDTKEEFRVDNRGSTGTGVGGLWQNHGEKVVEDE